MKIILHGATDCGSSNYGDFLYGKLIYDYLINKLNVSADNIFFYNPSIFFEKNIDKKRNGHLKGTVKHSDAAIYIPGGYFGEGHNASWKETLVQIMRFIPFGLKCAFYKVPLAVIGVGAGPNNNLIFKKCIKFIVNYGKIVTVRDEESFNALKQIGCKNVISCSDLIVAFDMKAYDSGNNVSGCCECITEKLKNSKKKGLLIHFNHSKKAAKVFGKAVHLFIQQNPDYYPVVSSDQLLSNESELIEVFEYA